MSKLNNYQQDEITTNKEQNKIPDINMDNVAIGDRFKVGKKTTAKVVDIREIKSMVTGLTTGYQCIAKGENLATNEFEVPFSTVVRNRIVSMAELQEMAELENWDD